MASKLTILEAFPEITLLGKTEVQRLCDAWIKTPLAKEFAVSNVIVDDELSLAPEFELNHNVSDGETVIFPVDELLAYIADFGLTDQMQRDCVKQRITDSRQRFGPDVFRKLKLNLGPMFALFITCPKCGNVMPTQWSICRGQKLVIEGGVVECTKCPNVFPIDGSELHFESGRLVTPKLK